MAALPVLHIESLYDPREYPLPQLQCVVRVASALDRGRFVFVAPPQREQ